MIRRYTSLLILFFIAITNNVSAQNSDLSQILTYQEYLAYIKQHHPIAKQANLTLSAGEANLLKSRGGFDPKIEVDYSRKKFKNTEYYDKLNTTFKIPTWYGLEFKANFENNTGQFLNPELNIPTDGLYSAGVSLSLAQGLLINERMATLKKAKEYLKQTKADQQLQINDLIYKASLAYFNWLQTNNELNIYKSFIKNAETRFKAVKRNVEIGEKAAIDSIEAKIALQNRKLSLEAAKLKAQKSALNASNYLWINDLPVAIKSNISPQAPSNDILTTALFLKELNVDSSSVDNHPKLKSIGAKINQLKIDRALKKNKLLPKLDLQYNFLSQQVNTTNNFNTANYKAFVNFRLPLFLRKERGDYKLAKLKIKDAQFERAVSTLNIKNKIEATVIEIESLETQNELLFNIVDNYKTMLKAEERKFYLGESSLFLVNSREQKLIKAQLKSNKLTVKSLNANVKLFKALGINVN